ncbi:MAG: hypothetical protein ACI9TP_000411 [Candidatus Azotimanducaceae bacterium]|jgi:hypothetical protein
MNNTRKILTLGFVTLLMGCGGGGGGDAAAPSPSAPASTVATTPVPSTTIATTIDVATTAGADAVAVDSQVSVSRMRDLVSSDNFDFTSGAKLDVLVDLSSMSGTDGYLTICSRYSGSGANIDIDNDSCLLQGQLSNGAFAGSLTITGDIKALVVAIWRFDGSMPTTTIWQRATGSQTITIFD